MKISKAIIPAAGLGTRFLPFTKAVPKELLPLINIPTLQYVIEEAVSAGITDFCVIKSEEKQALVDYLTPSDRLRTILTQRDKKQLLAPVIELLDRARFSFVDQDEPLGLGHAVLLGKEAMHGEWCAVILPDDILRSTNPGIGQLITIAQKYHANVIAVTEVPREKTASYGIVAPKMQHDERTYEVASLVEKPDPKDAPSQLAIIGRYVLSPTIFDHLAITKPQHGGEIQLTDAIDALAQNGERVIAYVVDAERFDTGTPAGWLRANIAYALEDPALQKIVLDAVRTK